MMERCRDPSQPWLYTLGRLVSYLTMRKKNSDPVPSNYHSGHESAVITSAAT